MHGLKRTVFLVGRKHDRELLAYAGLQVFRPLNPNDDYIGYHVFSFASELRSVSLPEPSGSERVLLDSLRACMLEQKESVHFSPFFEILLSVDASQ